MVEKTQVPTIGRIVHYTNLGDAEGKYPPEAHPALITKVTSPELVSLAICYETGLFFMKDVKYSAALPASDKARGSWGWPPRL